MSRTTSLVVGLVTIAALGLVALAWLFRGEASDAPAETGVSDYRNASFIISGERVQFENGVAETRTVMGHSGSSTVRYFGNDAKGDLNGDGIVDIAFWITQETGGSGTFFYLVSALQSADGTYRGTEAVFVGDRVSPQNSEIRDGVLIANYADRAPGEPMTARPSVGKSLFLKLDPHTLQFGELVQNFEGDGEREL